MDKIQEQRSNLKFRKQQLLDHCTVMLPAVFGNKKSEYKKLTGFLKCEFLYVSGFVDQAIRNIESHDEDGIVFISPDFLNRARQIRKAENELRILRMNFPRLQLTPEKLAQLGLPDGGSLGKRLPHLYDELATAVYSIYNDINPEKNKIDIWRLLNSIYELKQTWKYELLDNILHHLVPVITDLIYEWDHFRNPDLENIRWNLVSRFYNYDCYLFSDYAAMVKARNAGIFHTWKIRNLIRHTQITVKADSEAKKITKFLLLAAANRKSGPYRSNLFEPNTFRIVSRYIAS